MNSWKPLAFIPFSRFLMKLFQVQNFQAKFLIFFTETQIRRALGIGNLGSNRQNMGEISNPVQCHYSKTPRLIAPLSLPLRQQQAPYAPWSRA